MKKPSPKSMFLAAALALGSVGCSEEAEIAEVDTSATEVATDTAVAPVTATDDVWGEYASWDADTNAELTRSEFDQRFGTVYADWAGTDGTWNEEEAGLEFYEWFDNNDDNIVELSEWNSATDNWALPGYEWGEYSAWDTDRDNRLTQEEFGAGFANAAPANATWSRDELADTWWDWWDGNDDNIVDGAEWDTRRGYWGGVDNA